MFSRISSCPTLQRKQLPHWSFTQMLCCSGLKRCPGGGSLERKTNLGAPLLSLTAIVLTGCMVGPHYVKPSTPTAPAFKEEAAAPSQANDGWKLAQPGDQTPRGNWWEIYGDP